MSQDKRTSRLFGSRISSIFSSNDNHHHLKTSDRNLSPKAPSSTKTLIPDDESESSRISARTSPFNTVSPSNNSQCSSINVSRNQIDHHATREFHDHKQESGSTIQGSESPNSQSTNMSIKKDRIVQHSNIHSPRAKLTRKPPPTITAPNPPSEVSPLQTTEAEQTLTNRLSDVMGSLEQEIAHMIGQSHTDPKVPTKYYSNETLPKDRNHSRLSHIPNYEQSRIGSDDADLDTSATGFGGPTHLDNISFQELSESLPSATQRYNTRAQGISRAQGTDDMKRLHNEVRSHNKVRRSSSSTDLKSLDDMGQSNMGESSNSNDSSIRGSSFKNLSSESYWLEQTQSSKESHFNEQQKRSNFDHEQKENMEQTPMIDQTKDFHSQDSDKAMSYYTTKDDTSSDFNDRNSSSTNEIPNSAGEFSRTPNHQIMYELESSNGTGSGLLSNWDEITEPVGQDILGALDETNRRRSLMGAASPSKTGSLVELVSTPQQTRTHTRMSSMSSVYSAGSNRHVSLATLKMAFSLRPGEGEKSTYVDTIRKSAGTSFNEAGPGKWKLPTGIMPVDKRDFLQQSSKKFNRGVSSTGYRTKKSSGVELKHGHLQPRLLAAEVDEGDNTNRFGALGRSSTLQNKSLSPVTSKSSTPSAGLNGVSRANSLERANTFASISTTGDLQSSLSKVSSSRRGSNASSADSVGSINNDRHVDIYYQHQGFKIDNDNDSSENDEYTQNYAGSIIHNSDDSEEEKPRLYLANPDSDSN